MAIEFHCDHCGKLIRAPQDAAGRQGKCPHCQQSVYIKTPSDQIEEVGLTPLDDQADATEARARREAQQLERNLLRERAEVADPADRGSGAGRGSGGGRETTTGETAPAPSPADAEELVVEYLQALAVSDLDSAERIAASLRADKATTLEVIERIGQDSIPPRGLENVPPAVLNGFLNSLRGQL